MNLLGSAVGIIDKVLDRVIPDKNARDEAKEALQHLDKSGELQQLMGQLEVNKTEARHASIFVAGWRPFIGWTCGVALAYNYIVYPLMKFAVVVTMPDVPALPVLDTSELMTLLLGMLGLAGYRTYEKRQNVAREGLNSGSRNN